MKILEKMRIPKGWERTKSTTNFDIFLSKTSGFKVFVSSTGTPKGYKRKVYGSVVTYYLIKVTKNNIVYDEIVSNKSDVVWDAKVKMESYKDSIPKEFMEAIREKAWNDFIYIDEFEKIFGNKTFFYLWILHKERKIIMLSGSLDIEKFPGGWVDTTNTIKGHKYYNKTYKGKKYFKFKAIKSKFKEES